MIKKTSRILTLAAATLTLLAACVEDDNLQQEQVPIRLTSDIAATRAIASPTQDTQLESGEKVYVWANIEATSGTADWTQNAYIQAWEMTADGSGNLSSSNTYYYPPTSLSMVAIHGNFSTSFVEGLSPLPDFVTHTVKTDQSTLANYAVSDLLYWKQNGVTGNNNPITIAFNHKLSKIEIHLVAGDYTENELDKMTVTLRNVLPTVSMDAIDGTVGQAYGTAVSITPLKKGKVDYEAIIPPQQKPLDFIEVRYNGTVVKVDAQVNGFDSDQRYKYDFGLSNKDIRKNPLWYVAEYNVNYDGSSTYSWATTPSEGYWFSWPDALTAASKFDGWHLPTTLEYNSIVPGKNTSGKTTDYTTSDQLFVNVFNDITATDGSGAVYNKTSHISFGYNESTMGQGNYMTEKSYWYRVNSKLVYAIRYCDSEFCSAWKYEITENGLTEAYPCTLTITSVLLGRRLSTSEAQSQYGTTESNWIPLFANLQFVNGNDEAHGAARRYFVTKGYTYTSSGVVNNDTSPGNNGQYWTATSQIADDADCFCFRSTYATNYSYPNARLVLGHKRYGRPIRLFRDNNVRPALPMDYIAMYNMTGTTTGKANQSFATDNVPISSAYYDAPTATDYFTSFNAYSITGSGKGSNVWHLPSIDEWISVIPPAYTTSQDGGSTVDVDGAQGNRASFNTAVANYQSLGERMEWGKTSSGYLVSKKFYNEYYSVGGASNKICYAIRYKDSDGGKGSGYGNYTTAFRYEYMSNYPASGYNSVSIKWKWLGANSTTLITDINQESYWYISDGEIIIPLTGLYRKSNSYWVSSFKAANSSNWNTVEDKTYGYWWSSTASSTTNTRHLALAYPNWLNGSSWTYTNFLATVRLFADAQ